MKPQAVQKDLEDAVDHSQQWRYEDADWTVDDFRVIPMGMMTLRGIESYADGDDFDSWLEFSPDDFEGMSREERIEELQGFRGLSWTERIPRWLEEGIPPVVLIEAPVYDDELVTILGDGRGRFNMAKALGIKKLPVVVMRWRGKNMKPRDNPLKPVGADYSGPAAHGGTQTGVHTADTLAQAVPYAQHKWDEDNAEEPDAPVVLVLDTSALKAIPDLDVTRAAKYLRDSLWDVGSADEFLRDAEGWDDRPLDLQGGDSVDSWLWSRSDPASGDNPHAHFRNYLEDLPPERADEVLRRAATGDLTPEEKIAIWGQQRFMEEIGPERLVGVYVLKPWWPAVVDFYALAEEWGDEEAEDWVKEKIGEGYNLLFVDDIDRTDPEEGADLVWGEDPGSAKYHGTSFINLLRAYPHMKKLLRGVR